MSLAVLLDGGDLEYAGINFNGLFAQRSNLLKPRFGSMLRDLCRFYRDAPAAGPPDDHADDAGRVPRPARS